MPYETLNVARDGAVAILTLNRPDSLNSLNAQLIEDLRAALRDARRDGAVRALMLTGAGRGFCAGADLAGGGFRAEPGWSAGEGVSRSMETGYNPLVRDLAQFPKPTVAAVNGVTAGGGVGLALAADIVIAGRSASFVQVFGPRLGLVPDMGVTWHLPRLVGRARARGLALLGEKLSAQKAAEWGLIWDCVDDTALHATALGVAQRLAAGPADAFARIKQVLDASLGASLDEQLEAERAHQRILGDTQDFMEGVSAFLQKREPEFGRGETS